MQCSDGGGFSAECNDDLHYLLAVAKDAAAMASAIIRSRSPRALTLKGDRDIVSDVDLAVEEAIKERLREHTPNAEFIGEEEGGNFLLDPNRSYWVLDPIDGTINFIHGVPLCAVSLSFVRGGQTFVAVVDLPFLEAQYTATSGGGSYANSERLGVSDTGQLTAALVSIDQFSFGENSQSKNLARYGLMRDLAPRVQRVRMLGTSAVDLIWTAQGRLDACILLGNNIWDTSAGVLIAREAGARVLDIDGSDHRSSSSATIACAPGIENELISILRASIGEEFD